MDPKLIIYPAIAMFFLTLGVLIYVGFSRVRAIKRGEVSIKYYQTYSVGEQPERLLKIGRHLQNHFEVPPLFYAGVLMTFVADKVCMVSLISAWVFVLSRCIHSVVHLGKNNVNHRFLSYALGLLSLLVIWGHLLIGLLSA